MSKKKLAILGFLIYIHFNILNIYGLLPVLLDFSINSARLLSYGPILLLTGVVFLIPKSTGYKKTKINLWVITFVAYLSLGMFSSFIFSSNLEYFYQAVPYYLRVLLEVSLFYFFFLNLDKRLMTLVLINITISYIIVALSIPIMAALGISLYESAIGLETTVLESGRPAGLAANANPAAFQSIIGLILIIYWLMNNPKTWVKYVLAILLLTQTACAIFTFSNTGMICLVFVFIFLVWKTSFLKPGIYKFLGFLLILFIASSQFLNISVSDQLNKQNFQKLENFVKIISFDDSADLSKRDTKIKEGISELKKSPIIGSGLGYFKHKISVHNTFLTIVGESGIIPLLLFLFVLAMLFKSGALSKVPSLSFLMMSSVVAYALFCITLQNMIDNFQYHFYFMMLLKNKNYFIDPLK